MWGWGAEQDKVGRGRGGGMGRLSGGKRWMEGKEAGEGEREGGVAGAWIGLEAEWG